MQPVRRVLMLTHRTPFPPDRGDRIRAYHLLRRLSGAFEVDLACVSDEPASTEQRDALSALTGRLTIHRVSPWAGQVRGGLGLLRGGAVTPAVFFRPALAATLERWHRQKPYDGLLTFCTGMAEYARRLMHGNTPPPRRHVLDLCDVDSLKWARYARDAAGPMRWVYATEADRLRRVESGNGLRVDAVTVISDAECEAYRRMGGHHRSVHVVGNGVDLDYFFPKPFELPRRDEQRVVFVGVLDYKPNVDAAAWFATEVMPALRERAPGAVFTVVGKRPTGAVRALDAMDGVEVIGEAPDVRPWLWSAAAVVAPLRLARGVQNKVLEAMACGKAVVCSPAAAEGIDATAGEHLLTATAAEDYVRELADLLDEPNRARELGAAARRRVEARYAWSAAAEPMIALMRGEAVRPWRQAAA